MKNGLLFNLGGRFRSVLKQWGRIKIQYELETKQVSAYCIKRHCNGLMETDIKTLEKLTRDKWDSR